MSLLVVLMCLIVQIVLPVSSNHSVAWCKNTYGGEWRQQLADLLIDVEISAAEVECDQVERGMAVALINSADNKVVDIIKRTESESFESFNKNVLRQLASYNWRVINKPEELQSMVSENDEFIVVYSGNTDSLDFISFCQAVLSPQVSPQTLIAVIYQQKFLPSRERVAVGTNLALWTVSNSWWSVVNLEEESGFKLYNEIIDYVKRLTFPSILHYSGQNIQEIYDGSPFHFITVFHRPNQLNEILDNYLRELAGTYRPYYAFITIDGEEFVEKLMEHRIDSSTELPLIILRKKDQKSKGIQVKSEYIAYTVESLSHLLASIISPDVNNEDAPQRESVSVSFIDHSALPSLQQEKTPLIVVLCTSGTTECGKIHKKLETAAKASSKTNPDNELQIFIIEIENIHILEDYDIRINSLPKVLAKDDYHEFVYIDIPKINAVEFVKIIIKYAKPIKYTDEDNVEYYDESEPTSIEDYYKQFEELQEDETLSFMYQSLPKYTGHLTTDNVSEFTTNSDNFLIAFYLPYCLPCRPTLLHILQLREKLQQTGIDIAIVNCAEYTDVCQLFNITTYPTIKIKKSGTWSDYTGIVSYNDLLATLTGRPDVDTKNELTPGGLIKLFQGSHDMKFFVIYLDEDLSLDRSMLFRKIKEYEIYWLNSTKYVNTIKKLIGSKSLPLLIWIDYQKKNVYHMNINTDTTVEDLENFFTNIKQGIQPVDILLNTATWTPYKPPIAFPSGAYIQQQGGHQSPHHEPHPPPPEPHELHPPPPDSLQPHKLHPPPPDSIHHQEL